jgi:hypothetical protein
MIMANIKVLEVDHTIDPREGNVHFVCTAFVAFNEHPTNNRGFDIRFDNSVQH